MKYLPSDVDMSQLQRLEEGFWTKNKQTVDLHPYVKHIFFHFILKTSGPQLNVDRSGQRALYTMARLIPDWAAQAMMFSSLTGLVKAM